MAEPKTPKWINIKDEKPPKVGTNYIICALDCGFKRVSMAMWTGGKFALTGRRSYWKVTHWMPMPEAPKEGKIWKT